MAKSKVAILKTSPATVLRDYHSVMNLAGYQDVVAKDADTGLKINISWHFFYPAASTTPWQLEGVIRAMKQDGYKPDLIHACHNRTVGSTRTSASARTSSSTSSRRTGCATSTSTRPRSGSTSVTRSAT